MMAIVPVPIAKTQPGENAVNEVLGINKEARKYYVMRKILRLI
jgi:hypothetical protein